MTLGEAAQRPPALPGEGPTPISHPRTIGRPVVVRRVARARSAPEGPPATAPLPRPDQAPPAPQDPPPAATPAAPALAAAGRVLESVVAAAAASTALYLVGAVYTDAYYGRLSIEATSLDLAPPYVALQSVHALRSLLEYPSTLLLLWVLYRTFSPARRLRVRVDRARRRFPRLLPVLANLAVVAPLLAVAFLASFREQTLAPRALLAELAGVQEDAALVLLVYAVWLGWSQRASIVSQVRARKLVPIALVFVVYLLNALATTAAAAEQAAELLLTGDADASLGVVFTMKAGAQPALPDGELLLVVARGGTFYVVERQPSPPSRRPTAYLVPALSVDAARVQRLNDAGGPLENLAPEGGE